MLLEQFIDSFKYILLTKKPTSPGLRAVFYINKKMLFKGRSLKSMRFGQPCVYRKNGTIIFRTRAGGHKRSYRVIDFVRRMNAGVPGSIVRIEYDPNRSAFIALVFYKNRAMSYIICPAGVRLGDVVMNHWKFRTGGVVRTGDSCRLRLMPLGSVIHNVELFPGIGAQMLRSAGMHGLLLHKFVQSNKALVRLRLGKLKVLPLDVVATLGIVSNRYARTVVIGKAGRNRWMGNRPIVRGVAMNPIDHPHGGGEGKKSKKTIPRTPWGKMLKWKTTSRAKFIQGIVL